MKRKSIIALLIVLCIVSCLALSACKDNGPVREADEVVIQRLLIEQSNKLVYENFTLRRFMGENNEYEIVWTSSDENAIKLTKQDDSYLAEPKMGDKRATVTLTAKIGEAPKEFTVYVRAYQASYFSESYTFSKNQRKVAEDFDLDTSMVINEGTAEERSVEITWEIDSAYSDYAKVVDGENGGRKVEVNYVKGEEHKIEINALFTYTPADTSIDPSTSSRTYEFTVADIPDPGAAAAEWYDTVGATIEFSGYLVGLGQAYYSGSTLKNVSVYVVDDNFQNAFYFYAINLSSSGDLSKLQPGVHVSAVGAERQSPYNGLIEGKGGTLTYDATIERINIEEHLRALDNDFFGNVPGLVRQTGNLVSIDGWKVTSKGTPSVGNSATVLTLQKNGKTITVGTSKYMEGFYVPQNSDPVYKALVEKVEGINVGDYVSVKGILSNYNNWQILPRNASDIEVVSSEGAVPTEGTKAAAAIAEMNAYLESNGLSGTVPANLSRDLPSQASNGVALSYRLCTRDLETITLTGNTLAIVPQQDTAETATVEIKYSLNGYETFTYFTFTSEKLSDAEIVSRIKAQIDANLPTEVDEDGDVTLPTKSTFDGVTITWAYKDGSGASYESVTKFEENVLSIYRADSDEKVELRATIGYNSQSYTHDVEITVKAYDANIVVLTPESLGLVSSYKDGSATINRYLVTYAQLYAATDGIQMRNNDTSKSAITVAFEGKKIVSVKFVYSSTKTTYSNENVLQFDYGTSESYGEVGTMNTVAGTLEYTFTPSSACSYMKIAHHASYTYTTYWSSITFVLADAE